jgi:hypothetical protein
MPPIANQLVTPERSAYGSSAMDEKSLRTKTGIQEQAGFLAMHQLMPYREELQWWKKMLGVNPAKKSKEVEYHDDEQSHNKNMIAWLQRRAGQRTVELWTQEEELVGMTKRGRKITLPVDEPKLRVRTTGDGLLTFPNDGENLFGSGQRLEAGTNTLDTLKLFSQRAVATAIETAQMAAVAGE